MNSFTEEELLKAAETLWDLRHHRPRISASLHGGVGTPAWDMLMKIQKVLDPAKHWRKGGYKNTDNGVYDEFI